MPWLYKYFGRKTKLTTFTRSLYYVAATYQLMTPSFFISGMEAVVYTNHLRIKVCCFIAQLFNKHSRINMTKGLNDQCVRSTALLISVYLYVVVVIFTKQNSVMSKYVDENKQLHHLFSVTTIIFSDNTAKHTTITCQHPAFDCVIIYLFFLLFNSTNVYF